MDREQSKGRDRNAAEPGGKPTPDTPAADVRKVGEQSRRKAGPDGPDAAAVGDTFKK